MTNIVWELHINCRCELCFSDSCNCS